MLPDSELLRRYLAHRAEGAFAELVGRHLNLVYGAALRRVGGDAHLAQDVTQQVFATLAREADRLTGRETLAGWLYTTTRNVSHHVVRAERRRRAREQEAFIMQTVENGSDEIQWEQLRPVLETAMDALSEADREAVLLRFFQGCSFAQIGSTLRVSEDAARVRVTRALQKLQARLQRLGVISTAAALGGVLTSSAAPAAPMGLAVVVANAIGAGAGAGAVATTAGTIFLMSKAQLGLAIVVVAVGAAVTGWQVHANADLRAQVEDERSRREAWMNLERENRQLAMAAAEATALRRDDDEYSRLAEQVATAKADAQRRAMAAKRSESEAGAERARRFLAEQLERMNREGNALVDAYKLSNQRAADSTLPSAAREKAGAEAEALLAQIKQQRDQINEVMRRAASISTSVIPAAAVSAASGSAPPDGAAIPSTQGVVGATDATGPGMTWDDSGQVLRFKGGIEDALRAYERMIGVTVGRDPSLAQVEGRIGFVSLGRPLAEAARGLEGAMLTQAGIVLDRQADGSLVAKRKDTP